MWPFRRKGEAPAAAPVELPVVAPEPVTQRLSSLPPGADPAPIAPVAQRSKAVSAALATSTPTDEPSDAAPALVPAQRLTLGQARRMGLGAPIRQVPDHSVQRAELPLAPAPQREKDPIDVSAGTRDSIDASSVTPAPIDASPVGPLPTHAVAQRVAIGLPLAPMAPMAPTAPTAPTAPVELSSGITEWGASLPGAPPPPPTDAVDGPRLALPLARPSIPARAPSVQLSATSLAEAADDASPSEPSALQRLALALPSSPPVALANLSPSTWPLVSESPGRVATASPASSRDTVIAPLVGARPLRPTGTAQRAASTSASPSG